MTLYPGVSRLIHDNDSATSGAQSHIPRPTVTGEYTTPSKPTLLLSIPTVVSADKSNSEQETPSTATIRTRKVHFAPEPVQREEDKYRDRASYYRKSSNKYVPGLWADTTGEGFIDPHAEAEWEPLCPPKPDEDDEEDEEDDLFEDKENDSEWGRRHASPSQLSALYRGLQDLDAEPGAVQWTPVQWTPPRSTIPGLSTSWNEHRRPKTRQVHFPADLEEPSDREMELYYRESKEYVPGRWAVPKPGAYKVDGVVQIVTRMLEGVTEMLDPKGLYPSVAQQQADTNDAFVASQDPVCVDLKARLQEAAQNAQIAEMQAIKRGSALEKANKKARDAVFAGPWTTGQAVARPDAREDGPPQNQCANM